jgi:alpha-ketoglutaric semialdehyde dehydrogenase
VWRRVTGRGAIAQAEMSGHNPAIVFDDANLDLAARDVLAGAMLSTGQKCTATRRAIVCERVYAAFVELLRQRVAALRIGDGLEPGVEIGPLVSEEARRSVTGAVEEALDQGLRPLTKNAAQLPEEGFFVAAGGPRRLRARHAAGPNRGIRSRAWRDQGGNRRRSDRGG